MAPGFMAIREAPPTDSEIDMDHPFFLLKKNG
jgi:hypothetical protein